MRLFVITGIFVIVSAFASLMEACTGITVRATNGDVVFCRTLEFDASYGGGPDNQETDRARSETCWTMAHDLKHRTFYYHTSADRTVRKVDVSRIDFDKLTEPVHRKLDKGEMTIIDRTEEITGK